MARLTKLELIRLLQQIPGNPVVATWDGELAQDVEIEQVVTCDSIDGGRVVILGMQIRAEQFRGVEIEWAANESEAEALRAKGAA